MPDAAPGPPPGANEARPFDLVGVGEAMVELWAEEPLGRAAALRRAFGGDVLNTLVMGSRLGLRTGFVSRVGNDPFGTSLLRAWRDEGVDTDRCARVDGVNGVYFIARLPGGEREFSYRRAGSAAAGLVPADIDPGYLARSRVLLLSGITQAISAGAEAATLRAAEVARRHGVWVAYDPNYRPALWAERGGLEGARAGFRRLLPLVDLLLASRPGDDALLWDADAGSGPSAPSPLHLDVPVVGLKRGAAGATLRVGTEVVDAPPPAGVRVVDTTGAGDAWNAGLLHALLADATPACALAFAHRVAGWKVARFGAIPPLDSDLPALGRDPCPLRGRTP